MKIKIIFQFLQFTFYIFKKCELCYIQIFFSSNMKIDQFFNAYKTQKKHFEHNFNRNINKIKLI